MGFGKKTDFETGRVLDLDKSYKNMIKPAVEAAGLKCIRADEIMHSGLIDVPMYEQLLNADVVVADLSTSNKNAFYELGVRHALRPYTTVIISEDGIKTFPFDINHVAVRQYHHLGEDIGYEEVVRFRDQLTKAIEEIISKDPRDKDSPVYTFLNGLTPPEITKVQEAVASSLRNVEHEMSERIEVVSMRINNPAQTESYSFLMQQVDQAQKQGEWEKAKTLFSAIRQMKLDEMKKQQETATVKLLEPQEDPYIIQRLSMITYKSKKPTEKDALIEAHALLNQLNPGTSNDTETLGLWGAVHKRLYEITKDKKYLDEAIRAYERGFFIRNDYYNGINFAFLLNVRASQETNRAEAIADFVEAQRVRKEVLDICNQWLANNPMPDANTVPANAVTEFLQSWYWVKATMGEAYLGMGEEEKAKKELQEAYSKAPEGWMKESTEAQLVKLKPLLSDSPLKFIHE
jgi:tetratricopeptide (TPR) repeat protein